MFSNLDELTNVANDLLQGKFNQAVNDSGRFLINSTLGVGGLFEVAKALAWQKMRVKILLRLWLHGGCQRVLF